MISTKKGDKGYTDSAKGRVKKTHSIIEFYGCLDECIALAGFTAYLTDNKELEQIEEILQQLFTLKTNQNNLNNIEKAIEKKEEELKSYLTHFIKPKGISSIIHYLRAKIRECERRAIKAKLNEIVPLLNRLSDLVFLIAVEEAKKRKEIEYFKRW